MGGGDMWLMKLVFVGCVELHVQMTGDNEMSVYPTFRATQSRKRNIPHRSVCEPYGDVFAVSSTGPHMSQSRHWCNLHVIHIQSTPPMNPVPIVHPLFPASRSISANKPVLLNLPPLPQSPPPLHRRASRPSRPSSTSGLFRSRRPLISRSNSPSNRTRPRFLRRRSFCRCRSSLLRRAHNRSPQARRFGDVAFADVGVFCWGVGGACC